MGLVDFQDLLRVQLINDNVQGFDTKWDEILFSVTKVHLHDEGPADEFQQSQAELKRKLERSKTDGAQFRSLC